MDNFTYFNFVKRHFALAATIPIKQLLETGHFFSGVRFYSAVSIDDPKVMWKKNKTGRIQILDLIIVDAHL